MLALHFRCYQTAKSDDPIQDELLFNPYLFAVYGSCNSEGDLRKVDEALFWSDKYTRLIQDIDAIFIRLNCDYGIWASHRALFLRSLWAWNRLQNALSEQVAACNHQEGCSRFTFAESTSLGTQTCCDGTLERSLTASNTPAHTGHRTVFRHGLGGTRRGESTDVDDEWAESTQPLNEPSPKMQKQCSSPASSRRGIQQVLSIAVTSVPPPSSAVSSVSLPFRGKRKAS
jgi:hypothetical protein